MCGVGGGCGMQERVAVGDWGAVVGADPIWVESGERSSDSCKWGFVGIILCYGGILAAGKRAVI